MDVTHLFGERAQPRSQPQVVAGYVSTAAPAPTGFDDPLFVIVPSFSIDRPHGPCKWGAIHGTSLPAPGAPCLLCFDDRSVPVVVWWDGPHTP